MKEEEFMIKWGEKKEEMEEEGARRTRKGRNQN